MPSASYSKPLVAGHGPGKVRTISDAEAALVRDILQEFSQYQIWRNVFAGQWEEAAQLILPTSRNTFFYGSYNWPGQKKTDRQIDATGALALHRFCAIADSLVTPRNMFWHGLENEAEYVMKDRRARLWYEDTTRTLFKYRYSASANFASQNFSCWQSLGALGNATMYCDAIDGRNFNRERGLRYRALPLGETFFGENHEGRVDRMIRWFRLTAYQAAQKFGIERLPESLLPALQQNSQYPYNFLHCVRPRHDYEPGRYDAKGLPFASYYVCIDGQCLMAPEGGYRVFPFAVRRYDQAPNEVYGRGPAQIVLPALKTLNAQKTTFLKQAHRAADPVLLTVDQNTVDFSLRPGSLNAGGVSADGKPLVHTLPTGNIQIAKEMMAEERGIIDDAFLVSLFKVLSEHPNMTATQVIELVNEKGMLVAPTLGRQHAEISQQVEREIDLLTEMRLIERPPQSILEAREHYRVSDTSPLSLAARAGQAAGFIRSLETSKEIVNITQDPSHLDWADLDVAMPEIARIQTTPERWIASPEKVAAKQKARAKQIAQQQAIQALPNQAAMISAQAKMAKAQPGVQPGAQGAGGPQQISGPQ